jgi:hypothetical protein
MFAVAFSGAPVGADSGTVFLTLYEKVKKNTLAYVGAASVKASNSFMTMTEDKPSANNLFFRADITKPFTHVI